MNELEEIRAQLHAIRTMAEATIQRVDALLEKVEQPEPRRPRYLGDTEEE